MGTFQSVRFRQKSGLQLSGLSRVACISIYYIKTVFESNAVFMWSCYLLRWKGNLEVERRNTFNGWPWKWAIYLRISYVCINWYLILFIFYVQIHFVSKYVSAWQILPEVIKNDSNLTRSVAMNYWILLLLDCITQILILTNLAVGNLSLKPTLTWLQVKLLLPSRDERLRGKISLRTQFIVHNNYPKYNRIILTLMLLMANLAKTGWCN